jgi:hypothetical protein
MTWKTSSGERVLGPKEGRLFLDLFDSWWEVSGKCADKYCTNVEPFMSLTLKQKQSVAEEVLVHLLTPTLSCPKLSAANESCIFSIFSSMMDMHLEVKEEVYGQAILDALKERGCFDDEEDNGDWPYIGCKDDEKWNTAIECLADSILWDRDWEMPFVQANPGLMRFADIEQDYFKKPRAKAGAAERVEAFCSAKEQEMREADCE